MKKLLFLPLFMLYFSIAQAQDSKFEIGPEIGINSSNYIVNDSDFNNSSITRLSFGIIGKINFSENWSIKSKIKYDAKGTKASDDSFEEKLNYITVPIMAEWNFGKSDLKGFLNFGIFGGFLTSAKTEFSDGEEVEFKELIQNGDFGASYGLGTIYKIKDEVNIIFEIGGQSGVLDFPVTTDTPHPYTRNQTFSANIGVTFGI